MNRHSRRKQPHQWTKYFNINKNEMYNKANNIERCKACVSVWIYYYYYYFKKNVFFAHIILQNKKMIILQLSQDQPKNVDWLASINHWTNNNQQLGLLGLLFERPNPVTWYILRKYLLIIIIIITIITIIIINE